jgi:hypothetical protein
MANRCVLLELFADESGASSQTVLNATDDLLGNHSRAKLAFIRYAPNETVPIESAGSVAASSRLADYYQGSIVPTALFDGTVQDFSPGNGTSQRYADLYAARAAVGPGASINATGSIAISVGSLHFEVFSPRNLSGHRMYLRAAIVENNVKSQLEGRTLHYVLRSFLGAYALRLDGNSSAKGQFNFAVGTGSVESQLGAVLFVQSDGDVSPTPKTGPPQLDIFAQLVLPVAVLVTGAVMLIVLVRFITSERKARLR